MIATWMIYCSLCAVGLSIAAALAERALLAGRGPVRVVWIGAMLLSLAVPAAAFRFAPQPSVAASTTTITREIAPSPSLDSIVAAPPSASVQPTAPSKPSWNWRAALSRADGPLGVAWLTLSLALALYFLAGVVALGWMRRRWRRQVVLGVDVLVSERTGPALVGAISPAIVVPEWALTMAPAQLALMLRHEEEHRKTGDGQILTAAQIALIAMPWNLALWWQIVRLRLAVELDCDARVLRDADARSYGNLLLEVARPRDGLRFMGATAFAERAMQLERRIRVMARRRDRAVRGARVAAASLGIVAVSVAWLSPRPPVPPRLTPQPSAPPVAAAPSPVVTATAPAPAKPAPDSLRNTKVAARDTTKKTAVVAVVDTIPRDTTRAAQPVRADSTSFTSTPPAAPMAGRGGRGGPPDPARNAELADALFRRLFDGIALAPDQESRARELISRLQNEQVAETQIAMQGIPAVMAKRSALQARRDSALAALLTNETDRATLLARVTPPPIGGRSGAPQGGGRRGGGGADNPGGAGGRGGGRGGPPPSSADMIAAATDMAFSRLFEGISLTPEQQTAARAAITKHLEDQLATPMPPMPAILVGRPNGLVVMEAKSDSAFAALLASDADRATLRSRIVVNTPPPVPPRQP